jgi:hypothetical protein
MHVSIPSHGRRIVCTSMTALTPTQGERVPPPSRLAEPAQVVARRGVAVPFRAGCVPSATAL